MGYNSVPDNMFYTNLEIVVLVKSGGVSSAEVNNLGDIFREEREAFGDIVDAIV